MALKKITNLFMLVAVLAAVIMLVISFYFLYQPKDLGKGITIDSSIQLPKNEQFENSESYIIPKSEVVWNGSKIIEIIEPYKERMVR